MAVELPEGFVLDAPQGGLPEGFVVDAPQSFAGNASNDVSQRWQNMQDIGNQARAGQLSLPKTILRMAGQETGALGDVLGEGISSLAKGAYDSLTTQGMRNNAAASVKDIVSSPLGQMATNAVKSGVGAWNQYESQNPGTAQDIKDAANIGSGVLGAKGLEGLASGVGNLAGTYVDMQTNALNDVAKGSTALSGLGAAPDVSGNPVSNFFAKNPNPLKVGMQTHDSINQAYDAAKDELSQSAKAARDIAPAVDAAPILDKLNKITGSLSGKTAFGEGEENALSALSDIKANLASKASSVASTAGEAVPSSVTASDLMDIESSINGAIPKGKATAGSRQLIAFKSTIQDALSDAGKSNPEFGTAYDDYKNKSISLAKNFSNNPSLKSIWQPNDYIAWKAYQNNLASAREANPILKGMPDSAVATQVNSTLPADQRINPYSPAALSRIGNVAKNLGKGDLGTISTLTKILPGDSNSLLRQALLIDKQKKISLGSALGKLVQGSPQQALQTATSSLMTGGKTSPLEMTLKNLKDLKN